MNLDLLKVSLRQRAVYIPKERIVCTNKSISEHTLGFLMNIKKLGFGRITPCIRFGDAE